jgi:hypothetical protein
MDLDLLNRSLPVVENPGLETTDPRLEEVASLIQRAEYLEAATRAEAVLSEGIYDIRLIGFFMYGVFLEQGMGSLKGILDSLSGLLRDNWTALGPAAKREKHTQTSLRWFLNQLIKKLQHEENNKSDLWEHWVSDLTSDAVEVTIDAAEELKQSLVTVLEDGAAPLVDGLGKLVQWLRTFQQLVYHDDQTEPAPELPVEEEEPAEEQRERESTRRPVTDMSRPPGSLLGDESGFLIEGSYHLRVLMNKMAAFERLLDEEKYPRAALVADDINEAIAVFDPRLYFPKLFARFSFLQAVHIQDLIAFQDQKETPEWQALKDFFKVDLDGFVDT